MKMTKEQIQEIHDKCLNLVKRKPAEFFNFKKLRKYDGSCNWTDIDIDYRKEIITTSYHECIHYLFPDAKESEVLYIEKKIMNTCSILEHAYFLKIISNKFYKSELIKHVLKTKNTKKKKK
jgi:hypothetical protein